jgi:hypothetical protein
MVSAFSAGELLVYQTFLQWIADDDVPRVVTTVRVPELTNRVHAVIRNPRYVVEATSENSTVFDIDVDTELSGLATFRLVVGRPGKYSVTEHAQGRRSK